MLAGTASDARAALIGLGAVPYNDSCPNDQRVISSPVARASNRLVGYVPADGFIQGAEHDRQVAAWHELIASAA